MDPLDDDLPQCRDIAFIGNFEPEHSSENDWRRTLTEMGHNVLPIQEQHEGEWKSLIDGIEDRRFDMVLWTRTAGLAAQVPHATQRWMQYRARANAIPTVGFHLDRWWGLNRENDILTEPWFRCEYVFTADGGHPVQFRNAGVNHHWSPPAIAPFNCVRGTPREVFRSDIAFVGSWQGGYHDEWQHRPRLVKYLQRKYGRRVAFWPKVGQHAVRGQDLADLYASVKVVVGDSCLVPKTDGTPMTHYCSDRVFETIGRGGLLLHPFVRGVTDGPVTNWEHLICWLLEDWDGLGEMIQWALDNPQRAEQIRERGYERVRAYHTYAERLDNVIWEVLE